MAELPLSGLKDQSVLSLLDLTISYDQRTRSVDVPLPLMELRDILRRRAIVALLSSRKYDVSKNTSKVWYPYHETSLTPKLRAELLLEL